MKWICSVCGYVYDEEKEGVPFGSLPDTWACPLCGAEKAMFDPEQKEATGSEKGSSTEKKVAAEKASAAANEGSDDWKALDMGEISALFSNLARGAEKQYQAEAAESFKKVASWFESNDREGTADMSHLASLVKKDLDEDYAALKKEAERLGDRGTLRALTWGSKVTMIAQSLIRRYEKDGDRLLDGTSLWMCTVCGFLFIGKEPPELCPVCKVPSWKFEKIGGKA